MDRGFLFSEEYDGREVGVSKFNVPIFQSVPRGTSTKLTLGHMKFQTVPDRHTVN